MFIVEIIVRLCLGVKDIFVLRRERREEMKMSFCGFRGRVFVGSVGSFGFKF